jgi:hypothetical protein
VFVLFTSLVRIVKISASFGPCCQISNCYWENLIVRYGVVLFVSNAIDSCAMLVHCSHSAGETELMRRWRPCKSWFQTLTKYVSLKRICIESCSLSSVMLKCHFHASTALTECIFQLLNGHDPIDSCFVLFSRDSLCASWHNLLIGQLLQL